MTLDQIARQHYAASGRKLTLSGFVRDHYQVSRQFFSRVAAGHKKPSARLLRGIAAAHVRLFPSEPVLLELPNHPPVLLGKQQSTNSTN